MSLTPIRSIRCNPLRSKTRHGEFHRLEKVILIRIDVPSALLLLQLLHHMQSRADSSAFLSRPERILPFIDYALRRRPSEHRRNSTLIGEGPVPTLRIVRDEDGIQEDEDEDGDMMRTAVNLLLSLFEGVKRLICMKQVLLILFLLQPTHSSNLLQPRRQLRESPHAWAS